MAHFFGIVCKFLGHVLQFLDVDLKPFEHFGVARALGLHFVMQGRLLLQLQVDLVLDQVLGGDLAALLITVCQFLTM